MSRESARRPLTPVLLGAFFVFGTAMTALAGLSLAWPDGPVALIWRVKPNEFLQLRTLGPLAPTGFFALSGTMALTAYGSSTRRRWGWALALIIFAANAIGDAARAIAGSAWEGLFGVAIATVILWWLLRRDVRALFAR